MRHFLPCDYYGSALRLSKRYKQGTNGGTKRKSEFSILGGCNMYQINAKILQILIDSVLAGLAFFLALFLLIDGSVSQVYLAHFEPRVWPVIGFNLVAFSVFGIYRRIWGFHFLRDYALLGGAAVAGVTGVTAYNVLFQILPLHNVMALYVVLVFVFTACIRFVLCRVID